MPGQDKGSSNNALKYLHAILHWLYRCIQQIRSMVLQWHKTAECIGMFATLLHDFPSKL